MLIWRGCSVILDKCCEVLFPRQYMVSKDDTGHTYSFFSRSNLLTYSIKSTYAGIFLTIVSIWSSVNLYENQGSILKWYQSLHAGSVNNPHS